MGVPKLFRPWQSVTGEPGAAIGQLVLQAAAWSADARGGKLQRMCGREDDFRTRFALDAGATQLLQRRCRHSIMLL